MRHSNDFAAPDLRPQIKEIATASGLTIRQLAASTGINKSRLSALLNSKAPLSVRDLQMLGFALNFDPREMIPQVQGFEVENGPDPASLYDEKASHVARQMLAVAEDKYEIHGDELTIDTMLRWYVRNGGRLAETDQIEKYVGIFAAPDPHDNLLFPEHIGPNTLAARSLNTKDPDRVAQYVASLEDEARKDIVFSYVDTGRSQRWQVFEREVVVDFPGAGPRFSLNYATLLMPVVAANHARLIVNFSVLLSTSILDCPDLADLG